MITTTGETGMAQVRTRENRASVSDFLRSIGDPQKRADCRVIARIMRDATGKSPKMWGSSIVGYDHYDYTYESGRSGSWMITGFSPRARNISIYIMPGFSKYGTLLKKLGKYRTGKSCLHIRRLDDVDQSVLAQLITEAVQEMRQRHHRYPEDRP